MPPNAAPKSTPSAAGPVVYEVSPAGMPSTAAFRTSAITVAAVAVDLTGTSTSRALPSDDGIGPTTVPTPSTACRAATRDATELVSALVMPASLAYTTIAGTVSEGKNFFRSDCTCVDSALAGR